MKEVRLFVSVPSCREWKTAFSHSFVNFTGLLMQRGIPGYILKDFYPQLTGQASCLSQVRQIALNTAIQRGATHWLSLDDDMVFPSNLVQQMLDRNKDVVTANYRKKNPLQTIGVCMTLDGKPVDSTNKTGIEQIGWMGGGCFLADIERIKNIPAPHFEVAWCKERNDYWDQDNYFSSKLRQHGCEIWVDHDLSQQVRHVGDYHYAWPEKLELEMAAE